MIGKITNRIDGFSGKFYANKGAGSSSIVPKFLLADPEGNLRIEYQGDEMDGSFVVVTPENVKYVFGIRETKESYGMVYGEAIDEHVGSYPGKASGDTDNIFVAAHSYRVSDR